MKTIIFQHDSVLVNKKVGYKVRCRLAEETTDAAGVRIKPLGRWTTYEKTKQDYDKLQGAKP